jgi:hypothetical protein
VGVIADLATGAASDSEWDENDDEDPQVSSTKAYVH